MLNCAAKPKARSIDNSKIDALARLRVCLSISAGDHTEDLAGGERVDVFVVLIGVDKERIAAEMGEKAAVRFANNPPRAVACPAQR